MKRPFREVRPPSHEQPQRLEAVAQAARPAATSRLAAQVALGARARVEGEAARLVQVRAGHDTTARQLASSRADPAAGLGEGATQEVLNELVRALEQLPANDLPGRSVPPSALTTGAAPPRSPSETEFRLEHRARSRQALALIEQIELFVRGSQRPALALTLDNSLGARVEIERLGPREIAVKLVGRGGPPAPDAVSRIRDALEARGLKVAALSVA